MLLSKYKNAARFEPPSLLIKRFSAEYGVPTNEARAYFDETKKFLILCAMTKDASFSPSVKVDSMWHQFILHTRDYFAFCDRLGTFVHHQPSEARQHDCYEFTRKEMRRVFGSVNERYWGDKAADCDSSSCDCCP